jgi:hypothetical protein
MKTPKSSSFAHGFGRGIKGKRTTKGSCIHPPPNPKETGLEIAPRKSPREGSENHQKMNGNNTSKPGGTTSNHLYTTKRFIQGLACHLIIFPSIKISQRSSQASPIEILGEIGRENRETK